MAWAWPGHGPDCELMALPAADRGRHACRYLADAMNEAAASQDFLHRVDRHDRVAQASGRQRPNCML